MQYRKLPPFLATHFLRDYYHEVPGEIWRSARDAVTRIFARPERFPKADFKYLDKLALEMDMFDA